MATNFYVDLPLQGGGAGVSSLNSLTGALSLIPGSNITITPSGSGITIASSGGGGGSPGSPTNSIQYNSSGSFAGSSGLLFDGTDITFSGVFLDATPAVSIDPNNRLLIASDGTTTALDWTGTIAPGVLIGPQIATLDINSNVFLGGGNSVLGAHAVVLGAESTSNDNDVVIGFGSIANSNGVIIGANAGAATGGTSIGALSRSSTNAISIGLQAGNDTFNATGAIFIGSLAGDEANNAANSIFIGNHAGLSDAVDNTVSGFSILIGPSTETGGFSNSIAIGDTLTNTASNQIMLGGTSYRTLLGLPTDDGSSILQVQGNERINGFIVDGSLVNSIDPNNRQLLWTNGTTPIIDWANGILYRQNTFAAINLEMNLLIDDSGNNLTSIDWSTRLLNSENLTFGTAVLSIDYQNRLLVASDGTTTALDWTNGGRVLINGITDDTVSSLQINGILGFNQIASSPVTFPPTGRHYIYYKADNNLYMMNEIGSEVVIALASGTAWQLSGAQITPTASPARVIMGGGVDDGNSQIQVGGNVNISGVIVDSGLLPSIDPYNRLLIDSTAKSSIDWQNRYLYFSDGTTIASQWGGGISLNDTTGQNSINVEARQLINASGGTVFAWNGGVFVAPTSNTVSLDFDSRILFDDTGSSSGASLKWNDRSLIANDGTTTNLGWATAGQVYLPGVILDGSAVTSLAVTSRTLNDTAGTAILDWSNIGYLTYTPTGTGVGTTLILTAGNRILPLTSSSRFKENIQETSSFSGKNLAASQYHRLGSESGLQEVGLIAEEAYEVLPEIVNLDEEGKPYSINMNAAIAVLFDKVRDLEEKLTKANQELSQLKTVY